jgi:hypothetical protein
VIDDQDPVQDLLYRLTAAFIGVTLQVSYAGSRVSARVAWKRKSRPQKN